MRKPAALLAGLMVLLAPLLLTACGQEPVDPEAHRPPHVTAPWRGEDRVVIVSVWEMHCAGCEIQVEEALKQVDGVDDARANWETSEVRIELDEDTPRAETIARIREAIHEGDRAIVGEDPVGP